MPQHSSPSERIENSPEEEARFVARPARHEKRPAQRIRRTAQRHQARRHERSEIVVTGTQLSGTNVPSHALADELEHFAPDASPALASPALARRRERAERKRRRIRRFVGRMIGLAVAFFVVQCGVAALYAPQFQISEVEIEGLKETDKTTVEAIAARLEGQNIFRADRSAIAAAVTALPTVKSARVEREVQWPMRTKLVVNERRPLLRVGAGQKWWVVDEEGIPYRRAVAKDNALYALTSPDLAPQTGKALPVQAWKRAATLALALEKDNRLAAVNRANSSDATKPFWSLRRLYLDKNGLAAVRVSGQSGALRAHDELLVRLGENEWDAKLERARQSLLYFERTGRRAALLDLLSLEYPRWTPQIPTENERTKSTA